MMRRAPLIGLLVALVLAAGYWFLLYKPALDEQHALEAETAQLVSSQQSLRNQIARLEEIKADEVGIRAAIARVEEFVPRGVAQPQAVREFQAAADDAGVEITSVTFGEPAAIEGAPDTGDPQTALASISVSMIVEGGYFQIVDFFRRVEHEVDRAVLTESVNLAEGQEGFPSLATTWGGQLFAVVPMSSTVDAADPSAQPDAGGDNGEQAGGGVEQPGAEQPGAGQPNDTNADSETNNEVDEGADNRTARGAEEGARS